MAMYAKVRRMRLRETSRRTSLSWNTIKGWLKGPARSEMQYRRAPRPTTITPSADTRRRALDTDAQRLYAQLQAESFPGSYCRVTT